MSLLSLLQEFDGKEIGEDENGEAIFGALFPGLSKEELNELAGLIPCPLPPQIEEMLKLSRAIDPGLPEMDFSGLSLKDKFSMPEIFPNGLPLAGDGKGNFWIADLNMKSNDWGPVFFFCKDPKVIVWQASNFEEFLRQLIAFAGSEKDSPIELVHAQYSRHIWQENPGANQAPDTSLPQIDPDLALFAQSLKKGYLFVDLRRARIGDGFSWGRYGEQTEIKRNGKERLFAYRKKPSFIEKIFFGK
ncbi:MAG: SMI1/KNR4 family protein [Candidatus Obscuribacterales bacterium]|nr:SMI1/KNR4 family protein [Candidatus Obscuribacterales bacterium]